ncbi:MAG TPA: class II fumarate hydratase [Kofleriaceae bacterium]|nr:class II fumarate hydratase [Kofleriaceae bacterium]
MSPTRVEKDTLGTIEVDADRLWGAQTERARRNFPPGPPMPIAVVRAIARIKWAAAQVNAELGLLEPAVAEAIAAAAAEVVDGRHDDHFPLTIWQSGSGTQTNMNVNEVVARRAGQLLGADVHPNDQVNRSQSTNDVFPTAMSIAAVEALLPLCEQAARLRDALAAHAAAWADIVKIGRTHLMDATPLTLGQEASGWAAVVGDGLAAVEAALAPLHELAIGGTAVGTGINAPPEFGARMAARLAAATGLPLRPAANRFAALAHHHAHAHAHAALRTLATGLIKVANDVRWLVSGPRAGLAELRLPANEPGSSIMPGKVNPTQAESLLMACMRVLGNDVTVAVAAASGNFELNVAKPLLAATLIESADALTGNLRGFRELCVAGLEPDAARIRAGVDASLMLVTALTPAIGYDRAAKAAVLAQARGLSLRDAVVELGLMTAEEFDRAVRPEDMVHPR